MTLHGDLGPAESHGIPKKSYSSMGYNRSNFTHEISKEAHMLAGNRAASFVAEAVS
jgi:hypothetical protein